MKLLIRNQSGLVAIVSVILIMIIISVITLSLSTLTRRELRQALDEQLATQAIYAAESGINDAINLLPTINNISDCSDASQSVFTNKILGDNIKYTCILVDKKPSIINTDVTTDSIKTFLLDTDSNPLGDVKFTWRNTTNAVVDTASCNPTTSPSFGCLTNATSWGNKLALLRVRLFPKQATLSDGFKSSSAIERVAYPGSINPTYDGLVGSTCAVDSCSFTVAGLTSADYYLQVYSYYKDANVTIEPTAVGAKFNNAQIVIDATGVAGDVVKRIKVTIPYSNTDIRVPQFGLSVGDSLCKRFTTNATITTDVGAAASCSAF